MAMQPLAQEPADQESRSRIVVIMNRVGVFFEASWALIITALLGLICLAAFGAPILSYAGLDVIAKPLFFTLSRICGQIPSHSFYIAGHQVGLCVHCLAIYSAMFAGGLLFLLSKKRLLALPWWAFVLLALPLAYDGFSQLFGVRESTWEIRLLTGALFGLGAAWFALPLVQKGLRATIPAAA